MVPVKIGELATAVGGRLVCGSPYTALTSVSTDSRSLSPGEFYIPLRGERFDGHDYIDQAVAAGAIGYFVAKGHTLPASASACHVIEVTDTLTALTGLAGLVRQRLSGTVVGITGSTGKTSTRDILSAVTAVKLQTAASVRNFNNEIGVPLTIVQASPEAEVLIVELGMRGPGQIADLAKLTEPRIGVITNVGSTHIGLLGSEENIAAAKGELIESLPAGGHAILNLDDKWFPYLRERTKAQIVTFGFSPEADFSAAEIGFDELGRPSWRLLEQGRGNKRMRVFFPGGHNVVNALAATAVGRLLGLSVDEIAVGLGRARLSAMRLSLHYSRSGVVVVNDAYNASPASMKEALETLVKIHPGGKHAAVLGRMAELGEVEKSSYEEVGRQLSELPVDILVTVGDEAEAMAAARGMGPTGAQIFPVADEDEAVDCLTGRLGRGDVVLVKASRVAGLEAVAERLVEEL